MATLTPGFLMFLYISYYSYYNLSSIHHFWQRTIRKLKENIDYSDCEQMLERNSHIVCITAMSIIKEKCKKPLLKNKWKRQNKGRQEKL